METFVNLWKKGCKTIRKALEYTNVRNNPPLLSNSFTTFARLVDCRPDPEWPMSQWFSTWNMNILYLMTLGILFTVVGTITCQPIID
jgi:hypothetical protein